MIIKGEQYIHDYKTIVRNPKHAQSRPDQGHVDVFASTYNCVQSFWGRLYIYVIKFCNPRKPCTHIPGRSNLYNVATCTVVFI